MEEIPKVFSFDHPHSQQPSVCNQSPLRTLSSFRPGTISLQQQGFWHTHNTGWCRMRALLLTLACAISSFLENPLGGEVDTHTHTQKLASAGLKGLLLCPIGKILSWVHGMAVGLHHRPHERRTTLLSNNKSSSIHVASLASCGGVFEASELERRTSYGKECGGRALPPRSSKHVVVLNQSNISPKEVTLVENFHRHKKLCMGGGQKKSKHEEAPVNGEVF